MSLHRPQPLSLLRLAHNRLDEPYFRWHHLVPLLENKIQLLIYSVPCSGWASAHPFFLFPPITPITPAFAFLLDHSLDTHSHLINDLATRRSACGERNRIR